MDETGREHCLAQLEGSQNHSPAFPTGKDGTINRSAQRETPQVDSSDKERSIAHSISRRFRKDGRITGNIGEYIKEFMKSYMEACEDLNLSHRQRMKYLNHVFQDDAKRIYRQKVANSTKNFGQASVTLCQELTSITRHNRLRKCLQELHLTTLMKAKGCSVKEGLETLRNFIMKDRFFYRHQNHRCEEDILEYMQGPVAGLD